jgi:thymidine kinase
LAKLYFRYSAMNAGKSMALLQVAHNYEEQGMNVVLFTSEIDNRFGHAIIASRLGVSRKGLTFTRSTNFYELLKEGREKPIACVLIDEAQFLDPEQVRQLHKLAHVADIPVICYGIRSDFLGEPFPGAAYLLTLADDIEELKNICACGRKATMNVRIDDRGARITDGEQIAIEGTVRYIQTCGRCFYNGT